MKIFVGIVLYGDVTLEGTHICSASVYLYVYLIGNKKWSYKIYILIKKKKTLW